MTMVPPGESAEPPQPLKCETSSGGNVNEEVTTVAVTELSELLKGAMALAGTHCGPQDLDALVKRVVGNLTVGPAMDTIMTNGAPPAMFQNMYVILVGVDSVRVMTFGFIGEPVSGDRPDMKFTPFCLRRRALPCLSDSAATRLTT